MQIQGTSSREKGGKSSREKGGKQLAGERRETAHGRKEGNSLREK
jgi:hypothetical protein